MTDDMMNLRTLLEKSSDADLLEHGQACNTVLLIDSPQPPCGRENPDITCPMEATT